MNRILVVDDEPDIVDLIHDVLTGSGYEVYTASSGEEALNMVEGVEPDLIVLDVVLPGLSGFEFCRKVKSKKDWATTRILFLTVLGRDIDVKWMQEAGCDDYLIKPFRNDEFLKRVDNLLKE